MTPPTQEKTMESWEHKLLFLANPKGMIGIVDVVDFITDLLASSQDSFRRKVEEEVIGKNLRHITDSKETKNTGKTKWDRIANKVQVVIDAENALKDKQRAKLINIK